MIVARTKGFFTHDQSFEWNSTHQVIILHPVATFRLSLLEIVEAKERNRWNGIIIVLL